MPKFHRPSEPYSIDDNTNQKTMFQLGLNSLILIIIYFSQKNTNGIRRIRDYNVKFILIPLHKLQTITNVKCNFWMIKRFGH